MISIGFLVNPYAGMGGPVGLKGTDNCVVEALHRGAIPQSPLKAKRFLSGLNKSDFLFYTAGGNMGENELKSADIPFITIYQHKKTEQTHKVITSALDTKKACIEILKRNVDIIIFCGGDGTARDIFSCTGPYMPLLGIPAGVKIYSSVFAITPDIASKVLNEWDGFRVSEGEIIDVDEERYRNGYLDTHTYGIAKIPSSPKNIQSCKMVSSGDDSQMMHEIASFIIEIMQEDTLYLLGAGSTTKAITDKLGLSKTLLGIDAIFQKNLIASDLNEEKILELSDRYPKTKIIISPIGAQGFVLGRGNQQISKKVIQKTGIESLIIVATEYKLKNTKTLYIDTGDPVINHSFGKNISVIVGYRMAVRKKLNNY
ncbi:MAG: ATP-NAD kinase family protein [Methanomicrobiales archaeon]|nr:ATP-NAD kinase family protein [Methanomicrobiales archaeon]